MTELATTVWDEGNAYFPPTSWQVSNIHGGTGASNIIPGELIVDFNFRFSTASTADGLKQRLSEILDEHDLEYELKWVLGGEAFLTEAGDLSNALTAAIQATVNQSPELSTTGGTSDGRFIAQICKEVVEFGPVSKTIHQIDERVEIASMEPLAKIYARVLATLVI